MILLVLLLAVCCSGRSHAVIVPGKTVLRSLTQAGSPSGSLRQSLRLRHEFRYSWDSADLDVGLETFMNQSTKKAGIGTLRPERPFLIRTLGQESDGPNQSGLQLERFLWSKESGKYSFRIGRQPITLGRGQAFSVLDLINPFSPHSVDPSYKPGVDALRVTMHASDTSSIEWIHALNRSSSDYASLLRYSFLQAGRDHEILAGRYRQMDFLGFALEGQLLPDFGIAFEGLLLGLNQNAISAATMTVRRYYSRERELALGYYYHELGAKDRQGLNALPLSFAYREQWLTMAARNAIRLSYTQKLGPLLGFGLALTRNLDDDSMFLQPHISYNLGNNVDVSLFLYHGFGTSRDSSSLLLPRRSEYGDSGSGAVLFLTWSF